MALPTGFTGSDLTHRLKSERGYHCQDLNKKERASLNWLVHLGQLEMAVSVVAHLPKSWMPAYVFEDRTAHPLMRWSYRFKRTQ